MKIIASLVMFGLLAFGAHAQSDSPPPEPQNQSQSTQHAAPPQQQAQPQDQTQTQPAAPAQEPSQLAAAPQAATLTIPEGTKVLLAVDRLISTKTTKPGDAIYLETLAPVSIDNQMAIPPGTYVQGVLDKIVRKGVFRPQVQLQMHFTTLTYANGYSVTIPGSLDAAPGQEGVGVGPGNPVAGAVAAVGAPLSGAAIGALANGVRGAAIGGGIGAGVGIIAMIALAAHGHEVFVPAGASVEMVINRSITLDAARVLDATAHYQQPHLAPEQARPGWWGPRHYDGTCYMPGTPGTPDTIVPGTPATPDSPGTPSVTVPGVPATPGYSYPCP